MHPHLSTPLFDVKYQTRNEYTRKNLTSVIDSLKENEFQILKRAHKIVSFTDIDNTFHYGK